MLWCLLVCMMCGCQSVSGEQKETVSPQSTMETDSENSPAEEYKDVLLANEELEITPTQQAETIATIAPTMPAATTTISPVLDTTAPVFIGLTDKVMYVGETISYKKGVTVTDDVDTEVTMEIDASKVRLDTPGEYTVFYTATDAAGNVASDSITVTVKVMTQKESEVNRLADKLIAELITEDTSKWDTCFKLWNWCRTEIKYAYSAGDRSSIYAGAYEGLHDRTGDCYAYYATFTVLLQKCGIETMEVQRLGGNSKHWWNLVNLGDGWYHCDSSPRKIGHTYRCFMQTDEQVQAYTDFYKENPDYYTFDKSLYPERETTIIYDGNLN